MKRVLFALSTFSLFCTIAASPSLAARLEFEKLHSVVLAGVHYNSATQTMTIKMRDDSVIEYSNVPHEIYERLKEHPLKGGFYRGHIANRFPSRVVPPKPEAEEIEIDVEEEAVEVAVIEAAAEPVAVVEPTPAPAAPAPVQEEEPLPTVSVVPAAVAAAAAEMPDLPDDFGEMLDTTIERAESVAETLEEDLFSLFDDADTTPDQVVEELLQDAPHSDEIDDLLQSLDDLLK